MTAGLDALLARVDAARMTATVVRLAGDDFAGRRTGSAGGAAARDWLRERLAGLGADVTADPTGSTRPPSSRSAGSWLPPPGWRAVDFHR